MGWFWRVLGGLTAVILLVGLGPMRAWAGPPTEPGTDALDPAAAVSPACTPVQGPDDFEPDEPGPGPEPDEPPPDDESPPDDDEPPPEDDDNDWPDDPEYDEE